MKIVLVPISSFLYSWLPVILTEESFKKAGSGEEGIVLNFWEKL